ncbi:hypothetical protein BH20ACT8_BH20ACT8_14410 [soil metagenome]
MTFDVKDFPTPLRAWAEGDRTNAGCFVVHGLGHSALGGLLRGLERLFARRPAIDAWTDVCVFLGPIQTR